MLKIVMLDDYEKVFTFLKDLPEFCDQAQFTVYHDRLRGQALIDATKEANVLVLMRDRTPVKAELIATMQSLKYVIFTGNRNTQLDYPALVQRNIPVSFTKFGPSKDATVELTWALILAAYKRLPEQSQLIKNNQWRNENSILPMLHGTRIGLVGLGEIGGRVAKVAQAFGMEVVTWSPHMTAERAQEKGVKSVSLEELLGTSRIVSLHLVPGAETRGLINAERLALMRQDAILVNTSRSALVKTDDLIVALQKGHPGFAALDVYDDEPFGKENILSTVPNLLITPHLGFVAEPVFNNFKLGVVECLKAYLEKNEIINPVE